MGTVNSRRRIKNGKKNKEFFFNLQQTWWADNVKNEGKTAEDE